MKISELIEKLSKIVETQGDLDIIKYEDFSYRETVKDVSVSLLKRGSDGSYSYVTKRDQADVVEIEIY